MYMRIVQATPKEGQIDEFIRRWTAYFGPRFQQAPGFRHVHLGYDRERNAVVTVSLWDDRPDEATTTAAMNEFRPQVADLMAGEPSFEEYEVLAQH